MTLRDYQQAAVESVGVAIKSHKTVLIVAPTASGKSRICAEIVRRFASHNLRVLVLVHQSEIIEQNFKACPVEDKGIYCAGLKRKEVSNQVIFASRDSLGSNPDAAGRFDICLVDECFVSGTLINTPNGKVKIENLKPGDIVLSYSGFETVKATSSKMTDEIYLLEFEDGEKLECTGNHKIFTAHGWKEARELVRGEGVFGIESVQILWNNFPSMESLERNKTENRCSSSIMLEKTRMLQQILLEEIQESNEQSPICFKNENEIKRNSSSTYSKRGKWSITSFASISSFTRIRRRVASGIFSHYKKKKFRISKLLQNRHCSSGEKDSDRNRWSQSFDYKNNILRRKEDKFFNLARLENISRIKCKSPRVVYNLHVSGHPSYFANGKLVHNCHMVSQETKTRYHKIFEAVSPKKIIGLTATPWRLDNGIVYGAKKFWEKLAYDIPMRLLIERGYLSPYTFPKVEKLIDADNVKVSSTGDYKIEELESVSNLPEVTRKAVETWRQHEYKLTMFFCCSVAHATAVQAYLGSDAKIVHAKTPLKERAQIIDDARNGKVKVLVNVATLCLDVDTEVLTKDGWKTIDTISEHDLTANWDNGKIWYSKVKGIIKRDRLPNEKMVVLDTPQRSIRVTEFHNILFKLNYEKTIWHKKKASEIVSKKITIPVSGLAKTEDFSSDNMFSNKHIINRTKVKSYYKKKYPNLSLEDVQNLVSTREQELKNKKYIEPKFITEDECLFIGFIVGDGWFGKNQDSTKLQISISDSYPKIQKWFENLCDRIGFHYEKYDYKAPKISVLNGNNVIGNSFKRYNFSRGTGSSFQKRNGYYKIEYMFSRDYNKYLLGLNYNQLKKYLEGFHLADGRHLDQPFLSENRGVKIVKNTIRLFESIQIACLHNNMDCKISKIISTRYKTQMYTLKVSFKNQHTFAKYFLEYEKDEWKKEKVWCVTTDSSNIITRRNGKPWVMGNTTGIDIPIVDCLVLLRATQSASLFVQICGRALRTAPGKTVATIYDFAGNFERFLSLEEPLVNLKGMKQKDKQWIEEELAKHGITDTKLEAATKECPNCSERVASARRVCFCGHLFLNHTSDYFDGIAKRYNVDKTQSIHCRTKAGEQCIVVTYHTKEIGVIKEWLFPHARDFRRKKANERLAQLKAGCVQITAKRNQKGFWQVSQIFSTSS